MEADKLRPFPMPHPGNTCAISGKWIAAGETCYAENVDRVRNGGAISRVEFLKLVGAEPVESPAPAGYTRMTVKQLSEEATQRGIDVPSGAAKADIIELLVLADAEAEAIAGSEGSGE